MTKSNPAVTIRIVAPQVTHVRVHKRRPTGRNDMTNGPKSRISTGRRNERSMPAVTPLRAKASG